MCCVLLVVCRELFVIVCLLVLRVLLVGRCCVVCCLWSVDGLFVYCSGVVVCCLLFVLVVVG